MEQDTIKPRPTGDTDEEESTVVEVGDFVLRTHLGLQQNQKKERDLLETARLKISPHCFRRKLKKITGAAELERRRRDEFR